MDTKVKIRREADADFNLSGVNHLPEEDDLIGALSGRMSQNSLRSEENYSGALFSTQTVSGTPPQTKKIESQTSFVGFISPRRNSFRPSCSSDDRVELVDVSMASSPQDEASSIPVPELPLSHRGGNILIFLIISIHTTS